MQYHIHQFAIVNTAKKRRKSYFDFTSDLFFISVPISFPLSANRPQGFCPGYQNRPSGGTIALFLLRICAAFCKLVHLARTTPPRFASESLLLFDEAWKQAQLCLSFGGLGIMSTSLHSSAAYIASLSISGLGTLQIRI